MVKISRFRLALAGVIAVLAVASVAGRAAAEEPVETAIKTWVASIDASPDWAASFAGLAYDAASKKAVLTGLAIRSEKPGVAVDFATISVSGFAKTADGGFSAGRVAADRGAVTAGPIKVAISDVEFNEFAMPAVGGIAWDPGHPFTSIVKAYGPVARVKMTNGRIGSFDMMQETEGVKSRITYAQFRIDRWADGKIAAITAGPLSMEAPSPDGLLKMNVSGVEGRDIDLDAFLRVYDPGRYSGGVGDMVWHPVVRLAAYHDFAIAGPGLKMSMGLLSMENFRLRQPKRSFAEFFDRMLASPDDKPGESESMRTALGLLSSYGLGRLGISRLDVQATGVDRLHLGGFNLADLSIEGLGEFAIDDFSGSVRDQGSVKIGRFAFGGVTFPPVDLLIKAAEADQAGDDVDVMGLIPKLGFVEAKGIDVTTPDVPRTRLDTFRVDLANYIGPIPTSIVANLAGLVLPVSLIEDADARAVFKKLGYDRIELAYGLKFGWSEADETVKLDDLHVGVKGAGSLAASMALGGLSRSAIEHPETLAILIPGLLLKAAAFTFTDDSIVGKGLDLLAEKMHAPAARFRQQFADAIPFLLTLTALNDPKIMALVKQSGFLAKLTPVLKAFIASPGSSITVTLAPPSPVSLPKIAEASEKTPETLAGLVGLSITGTGTAPAPTPAPAPPANPPPGNNAPPTGGLRPTAPAQ